jgi:hypothetical protein
MQETERTLTFHVQTRRCFSALLRRRLRDVDVVERREVVSLEMGHSFLLTRITDQMASLLASSFFPQKNNVAKLWSCRLPFNQKDQSLDRIRSPSGKNASSNAEDGQMCHI